jgi:hypothetical protein
MCNRLGSVVVREVDGEVLLLDIESNQIHQLNETASFIWRNCRDAASVLEITRSLAGKFDVDEETAAKDVAAVLDKLQTLNLIIPCNSMPGGPQRFVWAVQQIIACVFPIIAWDA